MISGRAEILVASDLVSRGLDIPEVTHIINLDIPRSRLPTFTEPEGRGEAEKRARS